MRKTKFIVAMAASVGLVAASFVGATSASASSGSNTGSAPALRSAPSAAPTSEILTPFKQYTAPLPLSNKYLKKMCYLDLEPFYGGSFSSGTMEKQLYGSRKCKTIDVTVTPGGGPVWQVGVEWATWNSPPNAEIPNPYVYYTNGSTSLKVTFSKPVRKAGLEAEPNLFQEETFTATYGGTGGASFSFPVTANGSAGSMLIGAKAQGAGTNKFTTIDIVDNLGDFAVAQIRACLKKC